MTEAPKVRVEAVPWWAWAILGIIVLLFAAAHIPDSKKGISSAVAAYPICANTESGVELTAVKPEAKLPLDPKCWSGWVSLPDKVDFKVDNGKGNRIEVMLFDGRLRSTRGDGKGGKLWDGNIRTSSFRLLGDGVATIIIAPKTSGSALKVVPTSPPATMLPPSGATPLPPAKPLSPKGGMV